MMIRSATPGDVWCVGRRSRCPLASPPPHQRRKKSKQTDPVAGYNKDKVHWTGSYLVPSIKGLEFSLVGHPDRNHQVEDDCCLDLVVVQR